MGTTPTPSNMSVTTLPKDIEALTQEGGVKLFGKWDCSEVDCKDISLQDYVQIRNPVWLPHTAGRYASKQFRKAQMPIVERLVCALMMNGRNNGKKQMAVRIVQHALEIVHLITIGVRESAFRNVKSISECLADELMNDAKGSSNSYAIKKKDELERVAKSNR